MTESLKCSLDDRAFYILLKALAKMMFSSNNEGISREHILQEIYDNDTGSKEYNNSNAENFLTEINEYEKVWFIQ